MAQLQCYDQCPDEPVATTLALMPCYQCPPPAEEAPEEPVEEPAP